MEGTEDNYIRYMQVFIERLCENDKTILEKYGAKIQWSFPLYHSFLRSANVKVKESLRCLSEGVKNVTHHDYHAAFLTGGYVFVSGDFCTYVKKPGIQQQEHCYSAQVIFISGKIACVKIETREHQGRQMALHNLQRENIIVREVDIIYIEAMHDHLYWKSNLGVIETTGTLLEFENRLSDCFVRIHRSYIINRNHMSRLRRFEVSLDNGDTLQIPAKKYSDIKKKLLGSLPVK